MQYLIGGIIGVIFFIAGGVCLWLVVKHWLDTIIDLRVQVASKTTIKSAATYSSVIPNRNIEYEEDEDNED